MTRARTDRRRSGRDEVIPIAEEELHVGKREVGHGRVRIQSRVVERPVQEQVTLREERVDVERRPVSGTYAGRHAERRPVPGAHHRGRGARRGGGGLEGGRV